MRILFVVQGEGRGHLTQAISLYQQLTQAGHHVVRVLVGKSPQRELPAFFERAIKSPVERFNSPNFVPSSTNKRVQVSQTILKNVQCAPQYWRSVRKIARTITEDRVDLVVNFYDVLTGVVYLTHRPSAPMVCVGHQYLFLHKDFVFPPSKRASRFLLKQYTRLTAFGARKLIALSFREMTEDSRGRIAVCPPLLRQELFSLSVKQGDYILGYMLNSGFSEEVTEWSSRNPGQVLEFFWDQSYQSQPTHWCTLHPLNDTLFLQMMAGSQAYVTTAGFESVCEAMYLGKPALMVPTHFEQECNAWDAQQSGAGVRAERFDLGRLLSTVPSYQPNKQFQHWAESGAQRVLDEVCSM